MFLYPCDTFIISLALYIVFLTSISFKMPDKHSETDFVYWELYGFTVMLMCILFSYVCPTDLNSFI